MLKQRLIVAIILIPLVIGLVALGGWFYTTLVLVLLGFAAWEFWRLFRNGGYSPSAFVLVGGVLAILMTAQVNPDQVLGVLSLIIMGAMLVGIVQFEQGVTNAVLNFGITLGGVVYLGVLGSYFIKLRSLPDGMWWVITVLAAVWLVDGGAYGVGRWIGKHKMTKRVSPKKSWEGYFGGVVTGALATALLAALWGMRCDSLTAVRGLTLGLVIGVFSPLGDLAESMFKREFGVKDSSNLLPGHGGFLDRIDSWMVAVPVSYYLIIWIWN